MEEYPEDEGIGSLEEPGTAGSWLGSELVSLELDDPRSEEELLGDVESRGDVELRGDMDPRGEVELRGDNLANSVVQGDERGELREVSVDPSA